MCDSDHKNLVFAFDFDGVVRKSNESKGYAFASVYGGACRPLGHEIFAFHMSNLSMKRKEKVGHFNKLRKSYGLADISLHDVEDALSAEVVAKVICSEPIPGFDYFFEQIDPCCRYLVTATPKTDMLKILDQLGLSFTKVYGGEYTKEVALRSIRKERACCGGFVYFGDTMSDLESAIAAGWHFCQVKSGGTQSFKAGAERILEITDFNGIVPSGVWRCLRSA